MTVIAKISREFVQTLRDDIKQALEPLEDAYGLKIEIGSFRYSTDAAETKVTFSRVTDDGNAMTPEARDFQVHAHRFGLKPEHLFQTFKNSEGKEYKLLGLHTRRPKYPIVCECLADGKRYKLAAADR